MCFLFWLLIWLYLAVEYSSTAMLLWFQLKEAQFSFAAIFLSTLDTRSCSDLELRRCVVCFVHLLIAVSNYKLIVRDALRWNSPQSLWNPKHMLRLFGEIRQTFFAYESFKLSLITRTVSATLVYEMLSAESREIYLSIHVCAFKCL